MARSARTALFVLQETLHRRRLDSRGVLVMLEQRSQEIGHHLPPPLALLEIATGFWETQAVYVAAKLGIADLLKDGPRSCDDLAKATRTHPSSLCRLMSTLA